MSKLVFIIFFILIVITSVEVGYYLAISMNNSTNQAFPAISEVKPTKISSNEISKQFVNQQIDPKNVSYNSNKVMALKSILASPKNIMINSVYSYTLSGKISNIDATLLDKRNTISFTLSQNDDTNAFPISISLDKSKTVLVMENKLTNTTNNDNDSLKTLKNGDFIIITGIFNLLTADPYNYKITILPSK